MKRWCSGIETSTSTTCRSSRQKFPVSCGMGTEVSRVISGIPGSHQAQNWRQQPCRSPIQRQQYRQERPGNDEYPLVEQSGSGDGTMKTEPTPEQRPSRCAYGRAIIPGEHVAQHKIHLSSEQEG
nr:hypothetical protein [Ktedonobacter robiniae]